LCGGKKKGLPFRVLLVGSLSGNGDGRCPSGQREGGGVVLTCKMLGSATQNPIRRRRANRRGRSRRAFGRNRRIGNAPRCARRAARIAKQRFEFIELLNRLEAMALLYNDGKLAPSTKKFTGKFLDQAVAGMQASEAMTKLKREAITVDDTFHELQKFEKRHAPEIRKLARSYTTNRVCGDDRQLLSTRPRSRRLIASRSCCEVSWGGRVPCHSMQRLRRIVQSRKSVPLPTV
jgi:hypothetical protein